MSSRLDDSSRYIFGCHHETKCLPVVVVDDLLIDVRVVIVVSDITESFTASQQHDKKESARMFTV